LAELVDATNPACLPDGVRRPDRRSRRVGAGRPPGRGPEEENDEYLTKRKSLRYGRPIIRVVRSGEFDRYRRRMVETGQRADGQFKVLRLTSDASFAAEFTAERDLTGSERTKT
jgi:hypothetical protein